MKRRHPWVFSGAVEDVLGSPHQGSTVDVVDVRGQFLARAFYSPKSEIRARIWTFEERPIDQTFFRKTIEKAIERRSAISTTARRLVFSESDTFRAS